MSLNDSLAVGALLALLCFLALVEDLDAAWYVISEYPFEVGVFLLTFTFLLGALVFAATPPVAGVAQN